MQGFKTGLTKQLKWQNLRAPVRLALHDLYVHCWHHQGLPDDLTACAALTKIKYDVLAEAWRHLRQACIIDGGKLYFPEMLQAISDKVALQERNTIAGIASGVVRQAQKDLLSLETQDLAEQHVALSPLEPTNGHSAISSAKEAAALQNIDLREQCVAIFAHWKAVTGQSGAILTPKRELLLKTRLKEGYARESLCLAVDGNAISPFHQGENDTGAIHNSFELIFSDAKHIDSFNNMVKQKASRTNAAQYSLGLQFVAKVCGQSLKLLAQNGGKHWLTMQTTAKWIDERMVILAAKSPQISITAESFLQFWAERFDTQGFPKLETVPRYFAVYVEWQKQKEII